MTHEKRIVTLDRTGHSEKKLIEVLSDKKASREQKDHELSMHLFERGAENVSMIVDLFRYKGHHTKESRVFQSQMRFDFETFVDSFVLYLQNQSRLLGITIGFNVEKEKKAFEKWLKEKGKGYTYRDFYEAGFKGVGQVDNIKAALIEMAIYSLDEAERLIKQVEKIKHARMAVKGFGIFIDKNGQPYSVNDPELDDIIKAERKMQSKIEKDD